jgi:hypothetical protein
MLRLLMLLTQLLVFPLLLLKNRSWDLFVGEEIKGGGRREDARVNCEGLIPWKATNDERRFSIGGANKLLIPMKSY